MNTWVLSQSIALHWISTECVYGKGTKDGVGSSIKWGKVFKNKPSKVCGEQPLNAVFHKFYLVHS